MPTFDTTTAINPFTLAITRNGTGQNRNGAAQFENGTGKCCSVVVCYHIDAMNGLGMSQLLLCSVFELSGYFCSILPVLISV